MDVRVLALTSLVFLLPSRQGGLGPGAAIDSESELTVDSAPAWLHWKGFEGTLYAQLVCPAIIIAAPELGLNGRSPGRRWRT